MFKIISNHASLRITKLLVMKENSLHLTIVTTEYTAASTVEALLEKESSSAGVNDGTAKTRSQSMGAS